QHLSVRRHSVSFYYGNVRMQEWQTRCRRHLSMARRSDTLARVPETPRRTVPDDVAKELHRRMLGVYFIEERLKILTRQGKISFHASSRGHEKLQVGTVMLLKPGHDWFFPYYREKGIAYALGVPPKDIFLHMLSREGDPSSGGRNMPEHFSARAVNLV